MPIDLWPLLRPFLVVAVLLATMYEPKKKRRPEKMGADRDAVYDADYVQLPDGAGNERRDRYEPETENPIASRVPAGVGCGARSRTGEP